MPKRPSFMPEPAPVGQLQIGKVHERDEDKYLCTFYNEMRIKAEQIPFSLIPRDLSKKIADLVTFPTLLPETRWWDVVVCLGFNDVLKELEFHKSRDGGPFFLFLEKHFSPDEQNKLWKLIWALWTENCTDVLENVQRDIAGFVSKYENDGNKQNSSTPASLDSGFAEQPSLTSVENYTRNREMQSIRLPDSLNSISHEMTFCQNPNKQDNCLLAPAGTMFYLKEDNHNDSDKRSTQINNFICPKGDLIPKQYINDIDRPDMSFLFDDHEQCLIKSKGIKIFVLHTMTERGAVLAEDIRQKLGRIENIEFEIYLFKDASDFLDMDPGLFTMRIIEYVDYVVPALTEEYLSEIQADGDPNIMANDRLILRYFHAVSQRRVINKNSLNYLIRPVLCDGVSLGMVRRWHEFCCALKYPKDLPRFAKNLYNTKQLLLAKNFYK